MEPFRRKVRNRVCDRRGIRWVSERKQTRSDTRPLHFQGSNVRPPPPPPQKSIALKEKNTPLFDWNIRVGIFESGWTFNVLFGDLSITSSGQLSQPGLCDSWVLVACSCYLPQLSPTQKDWDMPTKIVKCQNQFTHVLYIYIYTHPAFATLDASPELTIVTTSQ